jgi:hypothetical protein
MRWMLAGRMEFLVAHLLASRMLTIRQSPPLLLWFGYQRTHRRPRQCPAISKRSAEQSALSGQQSSQPSDGTWS